MLSLVSLDRLRTMREDGVAVRVGNQKSLLVALLQTNHAHIGDDGSRFHARLKQLRVSKFKHVQGRRIAGEANIQDFAGVIPDLLADLVLPNRMSAAAILG